MNELLLKLAVPIINGVVADLLSEQNIRMYGDKLFDFIEDAVKNSKTTIDDATILPLLQTLRKTLNIPDHPVEEL
jgi:hypothetical protein